VAVHSEVKSRRQIQTVVRAAPFTKVLVLIR
jgi:hypothetical protein